MSLGRYRNGQANGKDGMKMTRNADIHAEIAEAILAAMAEGAVPWHKPWKQAIGSRPVNHATGKVYRGANVWLLTAAQTRGRFETSRWVTRKQAATIGASVRDGSKPTRIHFYKIIEGRETDANGKRKTFPMLRSFSVFNTAQCDGVTLPEVVEPEPFEASARADTIIADMPNPPTICTNGGDRACYMPTLDSIHMPARESFESPAAYYGTLFHELAHSTGHASRLARETLLNTDGFGGTVYAREELTAELAAAYLRADAHLDADVSQSAAYIADWSKIITNDPGCFMSAAGAAQKATDYILGVTWNA